MKKNIILLFTALLLGFTGSAQVEFEAKVSHSTVGKGERFKVEFEVNAEASNFQAPDFRNFRVLSGPNRSTSMQIINFERSVKSSYSFILQARNTGTYQIGPASVLVDGETYRTDPVKITVKEESPRAQDPNDPRARAERSTFFRILTDKTTVYQGEPFVASYKLYFTTNVNTPQIIEEPDFTGFYRNNIEIDRVRTSNETYRGERYTTGILRQFLLIPQQTGKQDLGTVEMEIPTQVPSNRRDFFGRMLSQSVNVHSEQRFPQINVLPLPREGRPSSFNGAVGEYKLSVELSREELTANESVTLRVRISGRGNIKLIDAPTPEIPPAFEVYDPRYSENISVTAGGMSGSKTYEYLLIPRYDGTYKIPELKFSYFSPNSESYQTITSDELQITVTGGAQRPGGDNGTVAAAEKEKVDFIGEEILFIKTKPGSFREKGESFFQSTTFYSALGGMGVAFAAMIGFFFFTRKRGGDQKKTRSKRAGKVARRHLAEAKKALRQKNSEDFYVELSAALWGYFSDKFEIPQSRLSKDQIREALLERGADNDTADRAIDIMNRAEMARFTSAKASTPSEDYEETAHLLTKIEDTV